MDLVQKSQWQSERAARLHRICEFIKARVAKGQPLLRAIRTFSRRWNQKPFKSDPSHRYALNVSTLYRHYRKWRLFGETPAAFRLNYFSTARRIPAPVLVRFVELVSKQEFPSFRAAWQAFCVKGQKPKLGYHSLLWSLPRGSFAEFKRCWKAIRKAWLQIGMLRIKYTAEIRAHVPDRLPRRRAGAEGNFEI
jgi:hypothetical protein